MSIAKIVGKKHQVLFTEKQACVKDVCIWEVENSS